MKEESRILDELVSPLNKWDYSQEIGNIPYGDVESYRRAASFLDVPGTVEDWGCGRAYARQFFKTAKYIGVDGTASRYCDEHDDLRLRVSSPDGILLRHVLEHNVCWQWILQAACRAARRKLCLVHFIAFAERPVPLRDTNKGVYIQHLVERDVENILNDWIVDKDKLPSGEEIWYCVKCRG